MHGGLAMDKKISELSFIPSIDSADVSILVHNNTDYQFTFATLLSFFSSNLATGAVITSGTSLPQNNVGKNGDLFINTSSGAFAQKISGNWTVVYTPSSPNSQADGTTLYGLGIPNDLTGKNDDTYIDTGTGIFYKKIAGSWEQVFSMQNGPAGAKGDKGDPGDTGIAGKTILSGTSDPSNQSTGADGDFYINTNTWYFFGPKNEGTWGEGFLLKQPQSTGNLKSVFTNLNNPLTINWQTDNNGEYLSMHGDYPIYQELNQREDNTWSINATTNISEIRNDTGQLIQVVLSPSLPGQTNFIII